MLHVNIIMLHVEINIIMFCVEIYFILDEGGRSVSPHCCIELRIYVDMALTDDLSK